MKMPDPRNTPGNLYALREMLCTFSALLWTVFGDLCPLHIQVFRLFETIDTVAVRDNKEKFTTLRCAQVMWKVLKETRLPSRINASTQTKSIWTQSLVTVSPQGGIDTPYFQLTWPQDTVGYTGFPHYHPHLSLQRQNNSNQTQDAYPTGFTLTSTGN